MEWITHLLQLILALLCLFMIFFSISSFYEKERRAANISLGMAFFILCLFSLTFVIPESLQNIVNIVFIMGLLWVLLLFFYPFSKTKLRDEQPADRFDERDIMFARARLKPGTEHYDAYYEMRPENKEPDDALRSAPGLLSEKARFYHPLLFATSKGNFFLTEALHDAIDGPVAESKQETSKEVVTAYIKELAKSMGAKHVGVTICNPLHFYSHIGRGSGEFGAEINVEHQFAIAFTVEMDYEMIGANPLAPGVIESSRQYVEAAKVAVTIAATIREMGYEARAHIDGNYRVIAPLVARDAGLGEIGRMGLLITPDLGPRVRLGVITTNLPLEVNTRKVDDSVSDFCRICKKCAVNCPGRAIPFRDRTMIEGVSRWQINSEACFGYWVQCGTDCGRCMTICPFAHKNNRLHTFIRWGIRKSYMFRRFALLMDDLFYGRKPKRRSPPNWIENVLVKNR